VTYLAVDNTEQQGRPVELYELSIGSEVFRYTSAEDEISALSVTFSPVAIQRDSFESSAEQGSASIQFRLPADDAFVARYKTTLPSFVATVVIYKLHRGDGEVVLHFAGEVQTIDFERDMTQARVTALRDSQRVATPLLRYEFGPGCNNSLGDDVCQVALGNSTYTLSSLVTADNGVTLEISGAASYGDGWFTAGELRITATGERRMVIDHEGDIVRVMAPFAANRQGLACELVAGCDRSPTACTQKFNNYPRYLGNPFSPTKNPYQSGLS
jgi:uncharacterized phage protein (TIGR02218 family)